MSNYKEKLLKVNTFIFDYDGVLSDGQVILTSDGDALRTANVKDGYAMQLAIKKNYRIAIISGGYSESMKRRFETLKVEDVFLGVDKKIDVYNQYLKDHNLEKENILYMGDDIPDYEIMLAAGVPTCPSDAVEEIKRIATYISHQSGGHGCVRDIIEQVLKVQGKWMNDDAYHW
ncbi:MAG: HAD hydrolase-like protein [Bacteroidales bacterium]|jgi:3-deoxy-D-manno-octulosonate 8-phosphate phosphatase (KDO 8-P phosphatase)|nr:HAD hydrolase-like protein [Bacteroidales bacterium]